MDKINTAEEIFNKYAAVYQDKYMDVGLYHDSFDLFCSSIATENADILEIACGPGNITRYLLNKRPDFKILGTDIALNMVELAKINIPEAEFQVMDCRNIGLLNKKYDGIMCGFCLPYLSKEASIQLIQDASMLLKPDGVIYLSTMEDDYNKSGIQTNSGGDQIYMYFHEGIYLSQALEDNGFKIMALKRQPYPSPEAATATDLWIIARKVGRPGF